MKKRAPLYLALFAWFAGCLWAGAWIPVYYSDPDLVDRSELIVVARVVPGTIKFLPYGNANFGDHSLTLSITSVLKGKPPANQLTVLIHYGVTPVVGGHFDEGMLIDDSGLSHVSPHTIQIYSTIPGMSLSPMTKDAAQDNIWFLRHNDPGYQYDATNDHFGIFNSQDVQEMDAKPYFEALLSRHPVEAIKNFAAHQTDFAARARDSLRILKLREIESEPDANRRASRLAALLFTIDPNTDRGALFAVADRIEKEGPGAAAKLILPFNDSRKKPWRSVILRIWLQTKNPEVGSLLMRDFRDPGSANLREQIIDVWRSMGYRDSAPLLVELLQEEDRYWVGEHISDHNWWNDINNPICQPRRDSYGCIYRAVCALGGFKYVAAADEIEQTRERWQTPNFDQQGQIENACDDALKAISTAKEAPSTTTQ